MREDVEFTESPAGVRPADDEVLDAGSGWRPPRWFHRVPRTVWSLLTALLLVGAVALGVGRAAGDHRPHAAPPAPTTSPPRPSVPLTPEERAIGLVRTQARDPEPLGDVVRPSTGGSCRLVPIGTSPQRTIEATLRRVLPGFTVIDVGRILDPNSALCALTVRSRNAAGTVLVVTVLAPDGAPPRGAMITRVDDPAADTVTLAALCTARRGWAVRVGSDGPVRDEPRAFDLIDLAEDPSLRW